MNFTYRAYLANGREETGAVEAGSEADAIRRLAAKGRVAFQVKPAASDEAPGRFDALRGLLSNRGGGRFSQARLFLDLAILTEAGMTLPQALRGLVAGESVLAHKRVIETVAVSMTNGRSAAEAFGQIEKLSPETVALIASGERSAQMPAVLRALATQMTEQERRLSEFRQALAYPAFLLVMMCLALGVVIFVLVPSLMPIFENAGQQAPVIMRTLNSIGEAAVDPMSQLLLMGLVLAASTLVLSDVRKALAPIVQRTVLSLPFIGQAIHKTNSARYLASLSMLIGGGTPMTEALALAANSNPITALRTRLATVRDHVAAGERLPAAMEKTRLFDPKIISLVAVGDEVNRLPVVLGRASAILDNEAKLTISRMLAALTPTMTIVLGLVIGGLVVSVMTALLSINDLAIQS